MGLDVQTLFPCQLKLSIELLTLTNSRRDQNAKSSQTIHATINGT
jgi:hypothetical protein